MERGLEREAAWVLVAVCDKIVIPDEKYSAIVKVMYQRIHVIHQAENAFAEICSQFIHHALI